MDMNLHEVLHRRPDDFTVFASDWFANPSLKKHIEKRMHNRAPKRDLGLTEICVKYKY